MTTAWRVYIYWESIRSSFHPSLLKTSNAATAEKKWRHKTVGKQIPYSEPVSEAGYSILESATLHTKRRLHTRMVHRWHQIHQTPVIVFNFCSFCGSCHVLSLHVSWDWTVANYLRVSNKHNVTYGSGDGISKHSWNKWPFVRPTLRLSINAFKLITLVLIF